MAQKTLDVVDLEEGIEDKGYKMIKFNDITSALINCDTKEPVKTFKNMSYEDALYEALEYIGTLK